MPKKGGKRKKSRTHEITAAPIGANVPIDSEKADELNVPRSIVAKANSNVSQYVGELIKDLRKLMKPYTANNLREKSYNRMKDYAAVAGQLGVTHLLMVTQTTNNVILRLARFPDGPTLHFHINQYSLARQVRSTQKRPFESPAAFLSPPLVVLNNFSQSQESHVKLMRVTFQHMFPTINIKTVRLSECRRVVLFHLKEDGVVEMRHYAIKANPVGVSKSVKRILQAKIPDLGSLNDISEFIEGENLGGMSDSEAEDEGSRVILPDQFIGKGNIKSQQSAMKLIELGPRITLDLYKVEQGVNEGDILYHKYIQKSAEEAMKAKAKIEKAKKIKTDRKLLQEANVKRKKEEIETKRQEKQEKKKRKYDELNNNDNNQHNDDNDSNNIIDDDDEDDYEASDDGSNDYGDDDDDDDDDEDDN